MPGGRRRLLDAVGRVQAIGGRFVRSHRAILDDWLPSRRLLAAMVGLISLGFVAVAGLANRLPSSGYEGQIHLDGAGNVYRFAVESDGWRPVIRAGRSPLDYAELASRVSYVDLYDTRSDSDAGSWTHPRQARRSSWYRETLNTAARGRARPFPRKALLIANGAQVYVYDAQDVSLWMVFAQTPEGSMIGTADAENRPAKVFGRNGKLYVLTQGSAAEGLFVIDFVADTTYRISPSGYATTVARIAQRNTPPTWRYADQPRLLPGPILDGAVATVAGKDVVALAQGRSGATVLRLSDTRVAYLSLGKQDAANSVALASDGALYVATQDPARMSGALSVKYRVQDLLIAPAAGGLGIAADVVYRRAAGTPGELGVLPAARYLRLFVAGASSADGASNKLYIGTDIGVVVLNERRGSEALGTVGYLIGNGKTERYEFAMIGRFQPAPELEGALTGWSEANFLQAPRLHFCSGPFSAGVWVYSPEPQTPGAIVFDNEHSSSEGWALHFQEERKIGGQLGTSPGHGVFTDPLPPGRWHHIVLVSQRQRSSIYVNGKLRAMGVGGEVRYQTGLSIGRRADTVDPRPLKPSTALYRPFLTARALGPVDVQQLYQSEHDSLGRPGWLIGRTGPALFFSAVTPRTKKIDFLLAQPLLMLAGAVIFLILALTILVRPRGSAAVAAALVAFGLGLSLYAYLPGFSHPFRSDNYIAFNFFNTLSWRPDDLLAAARFEMFGHRRVHPLAHLLMFTQHRILGTNVLLHHLLQYLLHLANALLLFLIVRRYTGQYLPAAIGTLLFLTFYLHFDMVNWTYHSFVMVGTLLVQVAMLSILQYFRHHQPRYLYAATGALFLTQLFYESAVLFMLGGLLLFVLLAREARLPTPSFRQAVLRMGAATLAGYLLYAGIFLHEAKLSETPPAVRHGQVLATGDVTFRSVFAVRNVLGAVQRTLVGVWDPWTLKAFGFPSDLEVRDIVYQRAVQLDPSSVQFWLALLATLVIVFSLRPQARHLTIVLPLLFMVGSFLYVIFLGRGVSADLNYVFSQSHYWYFPDLVLAILLAVLLSKKADLHRRWSYPLLAAVLLVASLNGVRIRSHTEQVTAELSTIQTYISSVARLSRSSPAGADGKVFVNFPVTQENEAFNLGLDVALDTYYPDRITRHIREAKYVLERDGRIVGNPLFSPGLADPDASDFTVEFVYVRQSPYYPRPFTCFGKRQGDWSIEFDPDGRLFFKATWVNGNGEAMKRWFTPGHEFDYNVFYHIIVQKEGGRFYFVVNGEVVSVEDVHGWRVRLPRDRSEILGDFYRGARVIAFCTNSFVTLGRAQYPLSGKKVHDRIDVTWVAPWANIAILY